MRITLIDKPANPLRGLLTAQFFGAFNDNAWKLIVALLGMRAIADELGAGTAAFESAAQARTTFAFVIFTLPLVLVSLPAGALADRISKRSIIIAMKVAEIVLMGAGTLTLIVDPSGGWAPLLILALMGTQSALFSPAKYGILPELLPHEKLSKGNGLLETWTFIAIVTGTAAGSLLLDITGEAAWVTGAVLTLLAYVGFRFSLQVPPVRALRSEGGMVETIGTAWKAIRNTRVLSLTIIGSTYFWGIASLLGQDVLVYAKVWLDATDTQAGGLLAVFGLGVGGGSYLAARLSASKVELGLIPLGAMSFGLLTLILGLFAPGYSGTLVLLALLGVASGLIVVPLNATLQWRSPAKHRGAVIALSNVFVFTGVLFGSLGVQALSLVGLGARQILVAAAMMTVAGTIWVIWLLPVALLRLVLVLLTNTLYRLTVVGRRNVPETGGALLVPNHISFADGLFLLASVDRQIRFIVEAEYFNHPLLRPSLKMLGAIPISGSGGPRAILRAFRDAGKYLEQGDIVCIFAEGQITRTGMLLPFRRGMERIVKNNPVPIVPVHLDRVWGSIFSRSGGRFLFKWPKRIPYPVTVSFGSALPASTSLDSVRRAVHELGQEAWAHRKHEMRPLHHEFVRNARRHPFALALADPSRPKVRRMKALAGAVTLARALRGHWVGQDRVGILLPPSVAGAMVNVAASLSGRASVNLNYTAGRAGMESAVRQARLRTVVTSREFLEKAKLQLPPRITPIWIENVAFSIDPRERFRAFCLAVAAPVRWLERACGAANPATVDDTVTIIFSSGSTGEPKGVLLSHFNIASNLEALGQVFRVAPSDSLLGILPLFHSFGYLSLWFALDKRMAIALYPNPVDGAAIGELVQRYGITFLVATPTFLQVYMRRCTPAQFGSLRVVLTGAEKLTEKVSLAFEDQFGIRPLEGYGTTECAPAVAASVPDFRAPGFYQPGSRRGTVGQPLPGVAVRIVDPETYELLDNGKEGMLLVKGPNVMKGYLGRDDLTAEVMRDGWYVTGDIATVDEDGFLRITDRLSRFSKIGGEMVPHGRVEEALQTAAGSDVQVFAVTSIPDEKKGERLAVLHTLGESEIPGVLEKVSSSGLPNLFIPKKDSFVKVDELPVLGTGKLDLRSIRRIAQERLG